MDNFDKPKAVSDVDMVFGGIAGLMPEYKDIPDEFKSTGSVWARWQASWFYQGLSEYPTPKDGIDLDQAMRHLKTIQGSFQPKHEHKAAAVAYLASKWFTSPNGEAIPA